MIYALTDQDGVPVPNTKGSEILELVYCMTGQKEACLDSKKFNEQIRDINKQLRTERKLTVVAPENAQNPEYQSVTIWAFEHDHVKKKLEDDYGITH